MAEPQRGRSERSGLEEDPHNPYGSATLAQTGAGLRTTAPLGEDTAPAPTPRLPDADAHTAPEPSDTVCRQGGRRTSPDLCSGIRSEALLGGVPASSTGDAPTRTAGDAERVLPSPQGPRRVSEESKDWMVPDSGTGSSSAYSAAAAVGATVGATVASAAAMVTTLSAMLPLPMAFQQLLDPAPAPSMSDTSGDGAETKRGAELCDPSERPERVLCSCIDEVTVDSEESSHNLLLLSVGYTTGFQVWDITSPRCTGAGGSSGAMQELVSIRDGVAVGGVRVRPVTVCPVPHARKLGCHRACAVALSGEEAEAGLHHLAPLVAVLPMSLPGNHAPDGGHSIVRVYSLARPSAGVVTTLSFGGEVRDVIATPQIVGVALTRQIFVFCAATLRRLFGVNTYPCPAPTLAPMAVGQRWLAYPGHHHNLGSLGHTARELSAATASSHQGLTVAHDATGAQDITAAGRSSVSESIATSARHPAPHHTVASHGDVGRVDGEGRAHVPDDDASAGLPRAPDCGEDNGTAWALWDAAKDVATGFYYLTSFAVGPRQSSYMDDTDGAEPLSRTDTTQNRDRAASRGRSSDAAPTPGVVVVRDVQTRRVICDFQSHTSPLVAIAFDPSGELVATAGIEGQTIHVHRLLPPGDGVVGPSGPRRTATTTHVQRQVQHELLFKLERGLTHALVPDLEFTRCSGWLAATSAHGTTHLFDLSRPDSRVAAAGDRSKVDCCREAHLPGGPAEMGTSPSGGATAVPVMDVPAPGLASVLAARLGFPSDSGTHASAQSCRRDHTSVSQSMYLAPWEARRSRRLGAISRGAALRIRHASTAPSPTHRHAGGVGCKTAASGESNPLVHTHTRFVEYSEAATGPMLVSTTAGMLGRYALGMTHTAPSAPRVRSLGHWDMRRFSVWPEAAHGIAKGRRLHSSTAPRGSCVAASGVDVLSHGDELRAHWLSHASISTHSTSVVPLWEAPLFSMNKSDSEATSPPATTRREPCLELADLFRTTEGVAQLSVRRRGPCPRAVQAGGPAGGCPAPLLGTSAPLAPLLDARVLARTCASFRAILRAHSPARPSSADPPCEAGRELVSPISDSTPAPSAVPRVVEGAVRERYFGEGRHQLQRDLGSGRQGRMTRTMGTNAHAAEALFLRGGECPATTPQGLDVGTTISSVPVLAVKVAFDPPPTPSSAT